MKINVEVIGVKVEVRMVHGFQLNEEIDVESEKEYDHKIGDGTADCVFLNVRQSVDPILKSFGIGRLFRQNSIRPLVD